MLLIAGQRPDATAVAGYQAWKALGRQVESGQKGIQILAPVVRRPRADTDPAGSGPPPDGDGPRPTGRPAAAPAAAQTGTQTGTQTGSGQLSAPSRAGQVAGFRVTHVWDLSQTSGKPLPTRPLPQLLQGQAPPGLWDALAAVLAERGFTLERGDCGQANGWTDYTSHTVRVRDDVDAAQAAKTLAHEAGHVLLHHPTDFPATPTGGTGVPATAGTAGAAGAAGAAGTTAQCRGVQEVEAESVAYLVAAAHGLPTDDYTFAYVAGWAASVDGDQPERVVRDTGQRVLTATRTVLAATGTDTTDPALADRVQAGAERTATARQHAEATLALTQLPATGPAQDAASAAHLDALTRLHADATAFYTAQLGAGTPQAARAAAVLTERAVPPAAVAAYELGYAPPGWTGLTEHLRGAGYTDSQLLDAGVALTTRHGTVVDRFRDRLMFPVHDATGEHIVAFLGRALDPGGDTPKYLNSPQTALYRKAEVLYGLGAAPSRQALAAGAQPVLVEGALDAIAVTCAGAGRYAGVAPSGTALTTGQLAALDRGAGPLPDRGVVVAFDADPAGRQAALRAFAQLRATGAWPTTVALTDGQDPAGLLQQHGPAALHTALRTAAPLADLVVAERLSHWTGRLQWAEGTLGAARDAAQLLATFPPEHVGRQVQHVAERLGLEHAEVTGAVIDALTRQGDAAGRVAQHDHRHDLDLDLDRGQSLVSPAAAPSTAAQLARTGYPHPLRSSTTRASQGLAESGPGLRAQPGYRPPRAAITRRSTP